MCVMVTTVILTNPNAKVPIGGVVVQGPIKQVDDYPLECITTNYIYTIALQNVRKNMHPASEQQNSCNL